MATWQDQLPGPLGALLVLPPPLIALVVVAVLLEMVAVEGGGGSGLPTGPHPQENVPSSWAQRYISSRKLERAEAAIRVEKAFAWAGVLRALRTAVDDGVVGEAAAVDVVGSAAGGACAGDAGDAGVSVDVSPEPVPPASSCRAEVTLEAATRPGSRPAGEHVTAAVGGGEISPCAGVHRSTCA